MSTNCQVCGCDLTHIKGNYKKYCVPCFKQKRKDWHIIKNSDPEYRKHRTELARKRAEDPEYRKRVNERKRQWYADLKQHDKDRWDKDIARRSAWLRNKLTDPNIQKARYEYTRLWKKKNTIERGQIKLAAELAAFREALKEKGIQ